MKKYLIYILVPLSFLLIVSLIIVFTYDRGPMLLPTSTIPVLSSATQTEKVQVTSVGEDNKTYPATPEAVVQAFLLALQADPSLALRYLSTSLKSSLPEGGPAALLTTDGVIEGIAIQSGAVSMQPPQAMVAVGLQIGGKTSLRRFVFIKENSDHWVINSVETVK